MTLKPSLPYRTPARRVSPYLRRCLFAIVLATSLSGCAGYASFRDGNSKVAEGDWVGGIEKLREATLQAPDNAEFRRTYYMRSEEHTSELQSH